MTRPATLPTPHANQILSWFREGEDTVDLAKRFGISESQAADLLHQARRAGFTVNLKQTGEGSRKGAIASQIARRNKPVTLLPVKFLQKEVGE